MWGATLRQVGKQSVAGRVDHLSYVDELKSQRQTMAGEASDEIGARVNVVPSGTVPRGTEAYEELELLVQEMAAEAYLSMKPYETQRGELTAIAAEAQTAVVEVYEKYGIEVDEAKLPKVIVMDEGTFQRFCQDTGADSQRQERGQVVPSSGLVYMVLRGEEKTDRRVAFHEMAHAAGTLAVALVGAEAGQAEGDYSFNEVIGMGVRVGKLTRGKVLEEGVVDYLAVRYAEGADERRRRDEPMETWLPNLDRYGFEAARRLVEQLVGDGGEEMLKLLLWARVDGRKKGALVRRINQLYNSPEWDEKLKTRFYHLDGGEPLAPVGQRLFQLQMNNQDVVTMLTELKLRGSGREGRGEAKNLRSRVKSWAGGFFSRSTLE